MQVLDSPEKYGLVSRVLHWGMAAIFLWQFVGMVFYVTLGEVPISLFFINTHSSLGAVLFLLVVIRLLWALFNAAHRPIHDRSTLNGRLAKLGHIALYSLMIISPALALLRGYGSGYPFEPFGISLWGASEEKIEWMISVGDAAHGVTAWALLALVVGHIAAAIWHKVVKRDQVWQRMVRLK